MSTAEERIHLVLVLALGAANLAILVKGPFEGPLPSAEAARTAVSAPPNEAQRAELDAAIQRLQLLLERARAQAAPAVEQQLALQGLGPTPDDRAHPEQWLGRLLGPASAAAWFGSNTTAGSSEPGLQQNAGAALVILLEAGVPLEREVSLAAAEKAPARKLSELVRRSLDAPSASHADGADSDPWQLDLLSFAVLGGEQQYRERLAQATQRALRRLDQAQRGSRLQLGSGQPDARQLAQLAREWRAESGPEPPGAADLHCSAAVFRATAVLSDEALAEQARRHLNVLLGRYPTERALYRYLDATARNARERSSARAQAIENLGRFEEALYNAHLTFRNDASAVPSPATARAMRLAARDLIERVLALDENDFVPSPGEASEQRQDLLRAAVHALRGLRTARVAG